MALRVRVSSLLVLAAALSPLWWAAGLLQFVWLPVVGVALVVHASRTGTLRVPVEARILLLFLLVQLFSSVAITEPYRYVTFLRSFWGYLTLALVFVYAGSFIDKGRLLDVALKSLVLVVWSSLLVSFAAAVLWIFQGSVLQFDAALSSLVPAWIRATALGQAVFHPSAGRLDWFMGFGYLRHTSMNLFATTYSMALVAALPVILWIYRSPASGLGKTWRRMAGAGFIAGLAVLALTTGRMSILGLATGAAWYGLVRWPKLRYAVLLVLVAAILGAALLGPGYADELLYARGQGSVTTRLQIYTQTWSRFVERPLVGWGSELDVPGLGYPLGSHSQYMSILFRFGVSGAIVWLAFMVSVWTRVRRIASRSTRAYLGWAVLAVYINGLTDVWDLDLFTFYTLALLFIIVYLCSGSMLAKEGVDASTGAV